MIIVNLLFYKYTEGIMTCWLLRHYPRTVIIMAGDGFGVVHRELYIPGPVDYYSTVLSRRKLMTAS